MPLLLTFAIITLLGFAAWRDLATRTIPNATSIVIALLGLGLRGVEGWEAVALSFGIGTGLFGVLLLCHARGLIGGADLKLLCALTLGLSAVGTYQLVTATAFAGGLLSLPYLFARRLPLVVPRLRLGRRGFVPARVAAIELRRMRNRCPLPYGVAIAAGGTFALLNSSGV